jgi:hypothetical protein
VALFLHLAGTSENRTTDVVTDVGEFGGFAYGLHGQPSFRNHVTDFPRLEKQAFGNRTGACAGLMPKRKGIMLPKPMLHRKSRLDAAFRHPAPVRQIPIPSPE